MTGSFTVTVQLAVFPPSAVLTVMVAVPAPAAFTFPLESTVATFVLLLVQVTDLFVALEGLIVTESFALLPVSNDNDP